MAQRSLKIFDQTLTSFHPSIQAPIASRPRRIRFFLLAAFSALVGLGANSNRILVLWIEFLYGCSDLVRVIPVVEQNGNL